MIARAPLARHAYTNSLLPLHDANRNDEKARSPRKRERATDSTVQLGSCSRPASRLSSETAIVTPSTEGLVSTSHPGATMALPSTTTDSGSSRMYRWDEEAVLRSAQSLD